MVTARWVLQQTWPRAFHVDVGTKHLLNLIEDSVIFLDTRMHSITPVCCSAIAEIYSTENLWCN